VGARLLIFLTGQAREVSTRPAFAVSEWALHQVVGCSSGLTIRLSYWNWNRVD